MWINATRNQLNILYTQKKKFLTFTFIQYLRFNYYNEFYFNSIRNNIIILLSPIIDLTTF